MTFDLHGGWEGTVGHHSTLYSSTANATDTVVGSQFTLLLLLFEI